MLAITAGRDAIATANTAGNTPAHSGANAVAKRDQDPADVAEKATITAEQVIAAFTLDAPVPVKVLYGLYGSRTTFHHWRSLGLDVKNVEGMGPTIIPSRFKLFLLQLRGDASPTTQPESIAQRAKRKAGSK